MAVVHVQGNPAKQVKPREFGRNNSVRTQVRRAAKTISHQYARRECASRCRHIRRNTTWARASGEGWAGDAQSGRMPPPLRVTNVPGDDGPRANHGERLLRGQLGILAVRAELPCVKSMAGNARNWARETGRTDRVSRWERSR